MKFEVAVTMTNLRKERGGSLTRACLITCPCQVSVPSLFTERKRRKGVDSNPGPYDPESDALLTEL